MKYSEMIQEAKSKGLTTETMMWESVEDVEMILCQMKKEHPKEYWAFLRKQHGRLYQNHYTEDFAKHDVNKLIWKDKEGIKHDGAYWTCEQIDDATKGMTFPNGVTKWDKFVAFNLAKSNLCKQFDDADILKIGYLFFFADEDWDNTENGSVSSTKVWEYVCCKYSKK